MIKSAIKIEKTSVFFFIRITEGKLINCWAYLRQNLLAQVNHRVRKAWFCATKEQEPLFLNIVYSASPALGLCKTLLYGTVTTRIIFTCKLFHVQWARYHRCVWHSVKHWIMSTAQNNSEHKAWAKTCHIANISSVGTLYVGIRKMASNQRLFKQKFLYLYKLFRRSIPVQFSTHIHCNFQFMVQRSNRLLPISHIKQLHKYHNFCCLVTRKRYKLLLVVHRDIQPKFCLLELVHSEETFKVTKITQWLENCLLILLATSATS